MTTIPPLSWRRVDRKWRAGPYVVMRTGDNKYALLRDGVAIDDDNSCLVMISVAEIDWVRTGRAAA